MNNKDGMLTVFGHSNSTSRDVDLDIVGFVKKHSSLCAIKT